MVYGFLKVIVPLSFGKNALLAVMGFVSSEQVQKPDLENLLNPSIPTNKIFMPVDETRGRLAEAIQRGELHIDFEKIVHRSHQQVEPPVFTIGNGRKQREAAVQIHNEAMEKESQDFDAFMKDLIKYHQNPSHQNLYILSLSLGNIDQSFLGGQSTLAKYTSHKREHDVRKRFLEIFGTTNGELVKTDRIYRSIVSVYYLVMREMLSQRLGRTSYVKSVTDVDLPSLEDESLESFLGSLSKIKSNKIPSIKNLLSINTQLPDEKKSNIISDLLSREDVEFLKNFYESTEGNDEQTLHTLHLLIESVFHQVPMWRPNGINSPDRLKERVQKSMQISYKGMNQYMESYLKIVLASLETWIGPSRADQATRYYFFKKIVETQEQRKLGEYARSDRVTFHLPPEDGMNGKDLSGIEIDPDLFLQFQKVVEAMQENGISQPKDVGQGGFFPDIRNTSRSSSFHMSSQ